MGNLFHRVALSFSSKFIFFRWLSSSIRRAPQVRNTSKKNRCTSTLACIFTPKRFWLARLLIFWGTTQYRWNIINFGFYSTLSRDHLSGFYFHFCQQRPVFGWGIELPKWKKKTLWKIMCTLIIAWIEWPEGPRCCNMVNPWRFLNASVQKRWQYESRGRGQRQNKESAVLLRVSLSTTLVLQERLFETRKLQKIVWKPIAERAEWYALTPTLYVTSTPKPTPTRQSRPQIAA